MEQPIREERATDGEEGPVSRAERQLAAAQSITHVGSWEWDARANSVRWSDELYRIYGLAPRSVAITFDGFLARLHPEDRDRVRGTVGRALESAEPFAYTERILRPDGAIRVLDTVGEPLRDREGAVVGLIGTCRDVTEERAARRMREAEQRVFELTAEGRPLGEILTTLALAIEEHSPPTIASILLLGTDGHLRRGAAPRLPVEYSRAVERIPIGPSTGSCGTAAFTHKAVHVSDIETDPLWIGFRDLARSAGVRACWSTPILDSQQRVLGTFALYYEKPRAPDEQDLALIARATHIAGLAIERRGLEDELRALSGHIESVREQERTGIAREIHDELGQALTALKMDLAWIGRRVGEPGEIARETLLEKIATMSAMTDEVIDQVRRISAELRPGVLDDLGLLAAVEWQAQEFERRTGATCIVRSNLTDDAGLGRSVSTALFRVFQEALTNVARHGEASSVEVTLEESDGFVSLEVGDDGKGIPPEAISDPRSLGLLGIRERARRLGGTAAVTRAPSRGTIVSVRVPRAGVGSAPP